MVTVVTRQFARNRRVWDQKLVEESELIPWYGVRTVYQVQCRYPGLLLSVKREYPILPHKLPALLRRETAMTAEPNM